MKGRRIHRNDMMPATVVSVVLSLFLFISTVAGARMTADVEDHGGQSAKKGSSSSPLGCKELRSKRYISDGQCSSLRPLVEVVCAGACLPLDQLPWYTDSSPATPTQGPSWTCSVGLVRSKRIHLLCPNGERKTYKVPVVRACKCVREPQVSQGS